MKVVVNILNFTTERPIRRPRDPIHMQSSLTIYEGATKATMDIDSRYHSICYHVQSVQISKSRILSQRIRPLIFLIIPLGLQIH